MQINQEIQRKIESEWFKFLQFKIVEEFQNLEKENSISKRAEIKYFKKNGCKNKNTKDGGGTYYLLKNGNLFDKVGINHSTVQGLFPKTFKSNIPGTKKNNSYCGYFQSVYF